MQQYQLYYVVSVCVVVPFVCTPWFHHSIYPISPSWASRPLPCWLITKRQSSHSAANIVAFSMNGELPLLPQTTQCVCVWGGERRGCTCYIIAAWLQWVFQEWRVAVLLPSLKHIIWVSVWFLHLFLQLWAPSNAHYKTLNPKRKNQTHSTVTTTTTLQSCLVLCCCISSPTGSTAVSLKD